MTSTISKLYLSGINDDVYITNVFDFENFLDSTGFRTILSANGKNLDVWRFYSLLKRMLDAFDEVNQNTKSFINDKFENTLFDFILHDIFAPALAMQFQNTCLFNPKNENEMNAVGRKIKDIFFSNIDHSNLTTLKSQYMNLNDSYYSFGSNFIIFGNVFDVKEFKKNLVDLLVVFFYPFHYFHHIIEKINYCQDFKCIRAYVLVKYVFVYHLFMSIFLFMFGDSASVSQCATGLKMDNTTLQKLKYKLVIIIDGILAVLQDENLLDSASEKQISSLNAYYLKIRDLSSGNIVASNYNNEMKKKALLMQNKLSNYNNYEYIASRELMRYKLSVLLIVLLILLIICVLIVLLLKRSFISFYIISSVTLLGLAVNGLFTAIKQ